MISPMPSTIGQVNGSPKINAAGAKAFADYIVGPDGQNIIKIYGVDKYGQPLFIPDAGKTEDQVLGR